MKMIIKFKLLVLIFVLGLILSIIGGVNLAFADNTKPVFTMKWGSYGSSDGQFNQPDGIATDSNGNIYIVDRSNGRVQKFDNRGNFITKWTINGHVPTYIAVDSKSNVYVVATDSHKIIKYNNAGTLLVTFYGVQGSEDGQFFSPGGITVDTNDNFYISDRYNSRIQKFSSDGTFITKWEAPGEGIVADKDNNIYVMGGNRIQKFSSDGVFITQWGSSGSGDGQFDRAKGLAVDSENNIYVTDTWNNRIQKFNSAGSFITKWGSLCKLYQGGCIDEGNGQFYHPAGTAIDTNGNIFVTDFENNRIQKFASINECTADQWTCDEWATCAANGIQTRNCAKTFDCSLTDSPSPATTQSCTYVPTCTVDTWDCTNWGSCLIDGSQTRTCYKSLDCPNVITPSPATTQTCTPECTADTWTCSSWNSCLSNSTQTRTCVKTNDCSLIDTPSPATTQSCTPKCILEDYNCGKWGECDVNGKQTRICSKNANCDGGISTPTTSQSCTYTPPTCTSWTYSDWGTCTSRQQTRTVLSSSPSGCTGGNPVLTQSCSPQCNSIDYSCTDWSSCSSNGIQSRTCNKISNCEGGVSLPPTSQYCTYIPPCTEDFWECSLWGQCNANNQKTRTCTKTYDCSRANTPSPDTTQSCNYTPPCNADKWECGNWGMCSPQGIQTRDCKKTYDCSSAETAPPASSQYCEPPNQPKPQTPSDDSKIINQDSITKATVKLICPVSSTMASQGSGSVISSSGTILTNKHVINGTVGCLIGFIDDYDDEPYFGDRQIADIYKTSSDADIAILKLRNPNNKALTSIDITKGNSSSLHLGDRITTYGYPAKFGTKITYTSGDFSGVDGNYLKTTAIIDSGNSGGGAYLTNGTFIGIPSRVSPGNFNIMGEILSINKINSWLNNSPMAYNDNSNNSYSRVSILEDIDLSTLNSLDLFIPEETGEVKNQQIKLIKSSDNPTVFEIKDGQRRRIRSGREFLALGYKWSEIVELSPAEVMAYPLGDPVTVEIKLLKLIDNPTVYEVINYGQAKPFTSAQEFLGKGYKWSEIKIVDQSELSRYLTSNTTIDTSQIIEINTKVLNLRAGPSTEDKKIGITYQGEKYAVLGSQNSWYKIEKNGLSGWVYGGYVK